MFNVDKYIKKFEKRAEKLIKRNEEEYIDYIDTILDQKDECKDMDRLWDLIKKIQEETTKFEDAQKLLKKEIKIAKALLETCTCSIYNSNNNNNINRKVKKCK